MIVSYLPVLMLFVVALLFPLGLIFASSLLGPRQYGRTKMEPYECGVPPVGSVRERFPVKFYRVAILFLLFDVEAAFLFPWAILFKNKLGTWGTPFLVGELALFLVILVGGYIFAWRKGGLEWD